MYWRSVLVVESLLYSRALAAAITQKVLQSSDLQSQLSTSTTFDKLFAQNTGLYTIASPVFAPCFQEPGPYSQGECENVIEKMKTDDQWTSDQPGGYFYANWGSCQSEGNTCALPLNSTARPLSGTKCHQGSVPMAMYNVSAPEHLTKVSEVLALAHKLHTPIVIKNTGHDWKGRSSAPGLPAIWMHNYRSPQVPITLEKNFQPTGCSSVPPETVFRLAAGETWGNLYHFAENNGLAVLGGTCGTVGVAGWLHGGGHSPLSPVYGMGVDNVRQLDIILPNGTAITANECQNSDLFFAVRGGGGGTWGLVTSITYKAIPRHEIVGFSADLTALAALSNDTARQFFDILTSQAVKWAGNGWGGYIKTATVVELVNANPNFTLDDAKSDMTPLTTFLTANNIKWSIEPYDSWFQYFADELEPPTAHPGGKAGAVASRLINPTTFDDSTRGKLTDTILDLHLQKINLWIMLVAPTIFPHTKTSALHPTWGTATWEIRISPVWDQYYFSAPNANRQYFEQAHNAMGPLRDLTPGMGVSINEADIWEENPSDTFWGEDNYNRLLNIKAEIDPGNVFSNWDAVGFNKNDARYRCYPKQ